MLAQAAYVAVRRNAWGSLLHHCDVSTEYGFGVTGTTLKFVLQKRGLAYAAIISRTKRKISGPAAS
ncbi:MAG: hypothetical protein HGA43_13055 [Nitrospirae bacterium]|nr:hypothetical protein [Nitrospirota bacterium]